MGTITTKTCDRCRRTHTGVGDCDCQPKARVFRFRILDIVFATILVALVVYSVRDGLDRRAVDATHQDRLDRHFEYIQGDYSNTKDQVEKLWYHVHNLYRWPLLRDRPPHESDKRGAAKAAAESQEWSDHYDRED